MKFLHLGVAVRDIQQGLEEYRRLFGYELRDGPYDDPTQRVSVCFVTPSGGTGAAIELVAPLGDDSPVSKLLEGGTAAYHLCFEVDDLEAALERVRAEGCVVTSRPSESVAFGGRRIVWLYTPSRQLVELVEAPQ